jgi:muramoyltetrapeptide carboxypeptidase
MDQARRSFLSGTAAFGATVVLPGMSRVPPLGARTQGRTAASRRPAIKPPRLRRGDTIGLVDPASATWDPDEVEIAEESLAALGFTTRRGAHLLRRRGYLAGTDAERAADFNDMVRDPAVRAIHCVRGGWGSARLLPLIDFGALARAPKAVIGYSDVTALLLAVHARTGIVTFHGPNATSKWNPFNVEWFTRVLVDGEAVTFENVKETGEFPTQIEHRVQTITPGRAQGRLLGGNLTVLATLIGSGFLPDWDASVLFAEDVNEAPYRIDRLFTQLQLAGILGVAHALIWGTCDECEPEDGFGSLTIPDILDDHVVPLGIPAWRGAMIGHVDRQFTLPIGADVEVDATAGTIRLLDPAVA